MHRLLVREVMQTSVIAIGPDQMAADAAQLMEEHGVRRLPVVDDSDDGGLVGIVTDSDVLEAQTADSVLSTYEPGAAQAWLAVADIMTRDVITIGPGATVGQLAQIFLDEKIGGLPVVMPEPEALQTLRVVGIVTEADVFRLIANAWKAEVEEHSALTI
jgi:acetoin utilization protein AcuB